ncbi:hypothetical protein [Methylibium sp. Pch-M]|uniref:hypothetical protein n=1 Tax=Methylibium sp. Pch-M TaxID=2082386 RepID=UPI001011E7A6|nr:hypothetical protein [Methylibium sp. Pch-M]
MATFDFGAKSRHFTLHPPKTRTDRSVVDFRPVQQDDTQADDHWLHSSFDLRRGLDVSEEEIETLPGELQDAFTKR